MASNNVGERVGAFLCVASAHTRPPIHPPLLSRALSPSIPLFPSSIHTCQNITRSRNKRHRPNLAGAATTFVLTDAAATTFLTCAAAALVLADARAAGAGFEALYALAAFAAVLADALSVAVCATGGV